LKTERRLVALLVPPLLMLLLLTVIFSGLKGLTRRIEKGERDVLRLPILDDVGLFFIPDDSSWLSSDDSDFERVVTKTSNNIDNCYRKIFDSFSSVHET